MQQCEKDFLFFYQWLMYTKSTGDESYLDFYFFIKLCEEILKLHDMDYSDVIKKTNAKNIVANYFKIESEIDIKAFKNNIFLVEDIRVRRNKWSLSHDML